MVGFAPKIQWERIVLPVIPVCPLLPRHMAMRRRCEGRGRRRARAPGGDEDGDGDGDDSITDNLFSALRRKRWLAHVLACVAAVFFAKRGGGNEA